MWEWILNVLAQGEGIKYLSDIFSDMDVLNRDTGFNVLI